MRGPINFTDWRNTVPRVLDTIKCWEDDFGLPVSMLAIDTVSAALFGGDENSSKDMGSFINTIRGIQAKAACHVVLTHHVPHDAARLRGHGALLGALDLTMEVTKSDSGHRAEVRKINDGPEKQSLNFKLESVLIKVDPDGCEITAPVVVPLDAEERRSSRFGRAKLPPAAQIALNALDEALVELGKLPDSPTGIPDHTKVVTTEQWRQFAYRRGIAPTSDKEDQKAAKAAQQKAFRRAHEILVSERIVGVQGTLRMARLADQVRNACQYNPDPRTRVPP